ncbi:cytochrome P450 [Massariosphaeria phaeospora]|uniref:Cytochrome P450 n=1 Tax=Massariosphaeria phaeospora TaxID=100035 RepID=A0A7C8IHS9_9PLEO|nr:cytochrome P450 [Massariosphaeria phaeospora]
MSYLTLLEVGWKLVSTGFSLVVLYILSTTIYNLTLHPLSHFPGPLLWRSTRIPYMRSMWSGASHTNHHRLHQRYGPVVRIAPNELSFADTAAWHDIFANRGGREALPKSAVWHGAQSGHADSLLNCLSRDGHAHMRRKMEPGFTERAVAGQEAILQGYAGLLVNRLREVLMAGKGDGERKEAVVDVAKWLTFVSLDIIGDLAFGEGFQCLQRSEMNEWMELLFSGVKAQVLIATLRYYMWAAWALEHMLPRSLKEGAERHWKIVAEKVDKRLQQATPRPDFIELWQKDGKGRDGLTRGEIDSNAFVMSFAGTETVATTLTGVMHQLVRSRREFALLKEEVRTRFEKEDEMSLQELKGLPYLNAVIWEGFRTRYALPNGTTRITPPEGSIICGKRIPGNTYVSLCAQALFLDPTRFHDPDHFHPERWLPEAIKDPGSPFYDDDRNAVQPFSVGPRSCIGRPLALAEARLILARLIWAFDVEAADTKAGALVWEEQPLFGLIDKQSFEVNLVARE